MPKLRTSLSALLLSLMLVLASVVGVSVIVGAPLVSARFDADASARGNAASPIIVVWTTKSEVNTAGFNLYRAESERGPFALLNRELIPATNDPVVGGTYVFTDSQTIAGNTYYYQLEDVELNGTRARHGTIAYTAGAAAATVFGMPLNNQLFVQIVFALAIGGILLWTLRRR